MHNVIYDNVRSHILLFLDALSSVYSCKKNKNGTNYFPKRHRPLFTFETPPLYPFLSLRNTRTHILAHFYSSSRIFVPPQRLTSQLRYLQKVVVFFWPTLTVKVDNVGRLYIINHSPHNRQTDRHTKTDMPHKNK